jgi:hypothetical protein
MSDPIGFLRIYSAQMQSFLQQQEGRSAGRFPASQGDCVMRSENDEDLKNEDLPAITDDPEASGSSNPLIKGEIVKCVDGRWSMRDGMAIPPDKRFIALGTAEGLQCWLDGVRLDTIVKKEGEPLPNLDELNSKIPEEQWDLDLNGEPKAPWAHSFAAYILDPADASIYTYINSTGGAAVAVRRLKERIEWMRALRHSPGINPVVTLGNRLHSKKFGKLGPNFVIQGEWITLGLPAQSAPQQLEHHSAPETQADDASTPIGEHNKRGIVKTVGKKNAGVRTADDPTWSEILGDDLPDDLKKCLVIMGSAGAPPFSFPRICRVHAYPSSRFRDLLGARSQHRRRVALCRRREHVGALCRLRARRCAGADLDAGNARSRDILRGRARPRLASRRPPRSI